MLRAATWHDFRPVWALEKLCFPNDAWPWVDILAALTFPDTVRLKCESEGWVAGFVIGDRRQRQGLGWIASIGVHPSFRRRGLGRLLLVGCVRALATPRVRLTLRRSNLAALELYRGAGYTQIDVWKGYYHNGEDGLLMEKVRDA